MTSPASQPSTTSTKRGLTSAEAAELLRKHGPNAVSEPRSSPVLGFLRKLSGPVPWMLEATLVIELLLRRSIEAIIIVGLLVLNATVSFVQERRAQDALALLRTKMRVTARIRRDDVWRLAPAEELVPGDLVHVRMGDMVPADLQISNGGVLLDESSLTGESMPVERHAGEAAYSGAIVRRGEATGWVVATGARSYFGRTAELVRLAKAESHIEALIVRIVKHLVAIDALLATLVIADAFARRAASVEVLPFVLMLLVASVPVALPAMFSLATALGASELAGRGALVTRLSAIEDAAAMDVLCSDKTGTLTQNQLSLSAAVAYPEHTDQELIELATHACDESTQDPLDLAILRARAGEGSWTPGPGVRPPGPGVQQAAERLELIPFDPATKRAEAVIRRGTEVLRIIKGAPQAVVELARSRRDIGGDVARLAERGDRVLAVAGGPKGGVEVIGLLGFRDAPREDASGVIRSLHELGVRVLMVTGDTPATARAVARELDIGDRVCSRDDVEANALACDVFAGVLPEDKIHLVRALQAQGRIVGMTGDGVNDAPALKQAEVGIAVASATDVAKAAASLVLTSPGLTSVLDAVRAGRSVYQRMLTYTLNKIIKTFQVGLFLSLGFLLTGTLVATPRAILLLLFANDFITMSLATDRVSFSRSPDRWDVRKLAISAMALSLAWLAFSLAVLFAARQWLHLDLASAQTMMFLMLVQSGQANVYLVRERRLFWRSRPGRWLMVSTAAAVTAAVTLAASGILMAPIEPVIIAGLSFTVVAYMFVVDVLKVAVFARVRVA